MPSNMDNLIFLLPIFIVYCLHKMTLIIPLFVIMSLANWFCITFHQEKESTPLFEPKLALWFILLLLLLFSQSLSRAWSMSGFPVLDYLPEFPQTHVQ